MRVLNIIHFMVKVAFRALRHLSGKFESLATGQCARVKKRSSDAVSCRWVPRHSAVRV